MRLLRVLQIKAGATTLMIPDTVGWQLSTEYSKLIAHIKANTPGIENVVISAHCHDDLGCSTSNSLAAAMAGAGWLIVLVVFLRGRDG